MSISLLIVTSVFIICIGFLWRAQKLKHAVFEPKPFLPHENPSHILIGDKPPLLGGTLRPIPLDEFEKKENIRWINSPLAYNSTLEYLFQKNKTDCGKEICYNFNDFAICEISPEVGKGIFATKPIKAGTIIGVYTGILNLSCGWYSGKYVLMSMDDDSNTVFYDAQYYRNMTSYVQHGPKNGDIRIACANMDTKVLMYQGVPVTVYITTRDISAHEQILFDYGEYYVFDKPFKFFDRRGVVLSIASPGLRPTPVP